MPQSRPRMGGITAMSVTSLQRIEAEVSQAISDTAASMPRKLLARKTGLSERYIKSLRAGEHKPSVPAALALALQHPELRSFFLRILGAAPGPASAALLREAAEIVERYGAQRPEEGDRHGG